MELTEIIIAVFVGWFVLWVFIVGPLKKTINKPKEQVHRKAKEAEIVFLKEKWHNLELSPYEYLVKIQPLTYLSDYEKDVILKRMEEEICDCFVAGKTPDEQTLKEWSFVYKMFNPKRYIATEYFKGPKTWREDFHKIMYQRHSIEISSLVEIENDPIPYQYLLNAALKRNSDREKIDNSIRI